MRTLEKPGSAGGTDGQGGMSVLLASGRLLPASGRWGTQGPQGRNRAHTHRLLPHPGGWDICVRPQLSWAQGARKTGSRPPRSQQPGEQQSIARWRGLRGGIVNTRSLPSWINRNSLSRSF